MMRFEVEKDGRRFEVEADDMAAAMRGLSQYTAAQPAQPAAPEEEEASVGGFVGNVFSDAGDLVSGVYQAVRHPIDTATAVAQNPTALADPYIEQASDPLGYAYEKPLSSLLNVSGAAGALGMAAKVGRVGKAASSAGKAAQVGEKLMQVSRATDPFALAATYVAKPLAQKTGQAAASVLGATTTAGRESVSTAAEAGFQGGAAAKAFRDAQMKRTTPEQVVDEAGQALSNIRRGAKGVYNADMAPIYADTAVQDFKKIRAGVDRALQIGKHTPPTGGKTVPFLPKTSAAARSMAKIVAKWEKRGPKYHTLGGLNDMKRELGEYVTRYEKGTPERAAADDIYNSVKQTIVDADPRYANIMRDYDTAQDLIRDVSNTLSLKNTAQTDTAIRKLQSALRDTTPNAAGVRRQLVQALVDNGADKLIYKIAGQNLQNLVRPGVAAQIGTWATFGGAFGGVIHPGFVVALATISPKVVGSGAYWGGRGAGAVVRPMIAVERAMRNKFKITGGQVARGGTQLAAASGRLAQAQEQKDNFKAALMAEAQKAGMDIHPKVLNDIVDRLLDDDPAMYMKGIEQLKDHKRLMKLFEAMGTKGEQ